MSAKRKQSNQKNQPEKKAKFSQDDLASKKVWAISDLIRKISMFMDMQSLIEAKSLSKSVHREFTISLHHRAAALAALINPLTAKTLQIKQTVLPSFENNGCAGYHFSINRLVIVVYVKSSNKIKFFAKSNKKDHFLSWNSKQMAPSTTITENLSSDSWKFDQRKELLETNVKNFLAKALLHKFPIYYAYYTKHMVLPPAAQPSFNEESISSGFLSLDGKISSEIGGVPYRVIRVIWKNSSNNNEISKFAANLSYISFDFQGPSNGSFVLSYEHSSRQDIYHMLAKPLPHIWARNSRHLTEWSHRFEIASPIEETFEECTDCNWTGCWITPFSVQEFT